MSTSSLASLVLFASLASAGAGGCVVSVDGSEATGQTTEKLETNGDWSQYQPGSIRLLPANDGFCFLTRLTGHMVGMGESVRIEVIDGYWTLHGSSGQQGVGGSAHCVTWDELSANDHHTLSEVFDNWAYSESFWVGDAYVPDQGTNYFHRPELWDRRSVCFLTGLQGAFNGGGERVSIDPRDSGWHLSTDNWTMSGADHDTHGYAQCAYLGQTGDIQFWGGDSNNAGEFRWVQAQQPSVTIMAPVDQAVCYLTRVTGRFAGGGESVWIGQQNGSWVLGGSSAQQDVQAGARCVLRQQHGLVRDGGFEFQRSRTPVSYPWRGEGNLVGADIGLGNQHSGGNNGFVWQNQPGWGALAQDVPVDTYRKYVLRGWIRTSSNVGDGHFGVRVGSSTFETKFGAMTDSYRQLEVHFSSGPNTTLTVFAGYSAPVPNRYSRILCPTCKQESWIQLDDVSLSEE